MRSLAAALVFVLAAPALAAPGTPPSGAAPATAAAAPAQATTAAPALVPPATSEAVAPAPAALPPPPAPIAPAKPAALPPPPPPVAPIVPGYGKTEGVIPGTVIGPKLSIFSLPAPGFGIEAKIRSVFGLSFDYDLIPTVSIGSVKAGYSDWRLAAKWYPWSKSFFLGAAYGSRTFEASAMDDVYGVEASAKVVSTYLAPELGWRWVWNSGFFMGVDLGYQIILSSKTTLEIPGVISTSNSSKDVQDAADELGKFGLPIISLLQLGFFF